MRHQMVPGGVWGLRPIHGDAWEFREEPGAPGSRTQCPWSEPMLHRVVSREGRERCKLRQQTVEAVLDSFTPSFHLARGARAINLGEPIAAAYFKNSAAFALVTSVTGTLISFSTGLPAR